MKTDVELGNIFIDALLEIVSTVSGISLDVVSKERDLSFDEISGMMNLVGDKSGFLFISSREPDMRLVCANMTGVKQNDVPLTDTEDMVCELVNMTAGSAKLRLSNSEYAFSLTQPIVIKGKDMALISKNRTRVISRVLSNGEVTVKFKIVY